MIFWKKALLILSTYLRCTYVLDVGIVVSARVGVQQRRCERCLILSFLPNTGELESKYKFSQRSFLGNVLHNKVKLTVKIYLFTITSITYKYITFLSDSLRDIKKK